jgi:hypothetical protein
MANWLTSQALSGPKVSPARLTTPASPLLLPRAGRRLALAPRAVAASERSIYEAIQQNKEFPPETTVGG